MKGLIFTEFLEMVEARFEPAMADRIIQAAQLPSGGAYTSVGTYDHGEMWRLAAELSKATGLAIPDLLRDFGEHLFGRLAAAHPRFVKGASCVFDFLESLNSVIHVEVRKLYADAELPRFEVSERGERRMVMLYRSRRHFADLAEGLFHGCSRHFGEPLDIQRDDLATEDGSLVRFTLTRR